jgi:hypothetical protein
MRFDGVGNLIQPVNEIAERSLQPRSMLTQSDNFTRQPACVVGPVRRPFGDLFVGELGHGWFLSRSVSVRSRSQNWVRPGSLTSIA